MGENLCDFKFGQIFLEVISKAWWIEEKFDSIKIKNLFSIRHSLEKSKTSHWMSKNIFKSLHLLWRTGIQNRKRLLLGRKAMTNLDSVLKRRDFTLPTKVHVVKAMVFPMVMCGCETWTVKKAENQRIDVFELWCWRRLLRVPWTARRIHCNLAVKTFLEPT